MNVKGKLRSLSLTEVYLRLHSMFGPRHMCRSQEPGTADVAGRVSSLLEEWLCSEKRSIPRHFTLPSVQCLHFPSKSLVCSSRSPQIKLNRLNNSAYSSLRAPSIGLREWLAIANPEHFTQTAMIMADDCLCQNEKD